MKLQREKVLIDTSVWIEFLKGKNKDIVDKVKALILANRALLCGVVISELLVGVRKKKERDVLAKALGAIQYVEADKDTWILAGELGEDLSSKGINIPLTDLIIAALALKNDYKVFTSDPHFTHIKGIKLL